MTPRMFCLDETVHMRGHIISFYADLQNLSLIITKYSVLFRALDKFAR